MLARVIAPLVVRLSIPSYLPVTRAGDCGAHQEATFLGKLRWEDTRRPSRSLCTARPASSENQCRMRAVAGVHLRRQCDGGNSMATFRERERLHHLGLLHAD